MFSQLHQLNHLLKAFNGVFIKYKRIILISGASLLVLIILSFVFINSSPKNYPVGSFVLVQKGISVPQIADILEEKNIIRSSLFFKIYLRFFGDDKNQGGVISGKYNLNLKESTIEIAKRLNTGETRTHALKVVIPEGSTIRQIGVIFADAFANSERIEKFNQPEFVIKASPFEGYLFPDTYTVDEEMTVEEIISMLRNTYKRKAEPLFKDFEKNRPSLIPSSVNVEDILTMASIIEEEGNTKENRQIISSILWRRYAIGMPLQVDASFIYAVGRQSNLTTADLSYDSPFNTYKFKGLPPHPISNPGIQSIEAALSPTQTPYLYYLNDSAHVIHYAKTFEEHIANRAKYLRM